MESGTRLGPYEILEQLGAGGMGEVYRARDLKPENVFVSPDGHAKILASGCVPYAPTLQQC